MLVNWMSFGDRFWQTVHARFDCYPPQLRRRPVLDTGPRCLFRPKKSGAPDQVRGDGWVFVFDGFPAVAKATTESGGQKDEPPYPTTVRPELVEGLLSLRPVARDPRRTEQCFDKLSTNGLGLGLGFLV